jgi:hypothetical protein
MVHSTDPPPPPPRSSAFLFVLRFLRRCLASMELLKLLSADPVEMPDPVDNGADRDDGEGMGIFFHFFSLSCSFNNFPRVFIQVLSNCLWLLRGATLLAFKGVMQKKRKVIFVVTKNYDHR